VPVVPAWMSWPAPWRWMGSLVLVGAGLAILSGYRVRTAALAIATLLLFVLAAIQLPPALGQPGTGYLWTNPCKVLAMLGGVLAIAGARGGTAWIFLRRATFRVCGIR